MPPDTPESRVVAAARRWNALPTQETREALIDAVDDLEEGVRAMEMGQSADEVEGLARDLWCAYDGRVDWDQASSEHESYRETARALLAAGWTRGGERAPAAVPALRWPAYDWTGHGYILQGTCGNCDRTALVTVERGHEAPWYHNGPECPCCGRIQWVGWHAPEEAPEKDVLAGLRAAGKIPHTPIDDDAPSAGGREAAPENGEATSNHPTFDPWEAVRYPILIEQFDGDGVAKYVASYPDLPWCGGCCGDTPMEAMQAALSARKAWMVYARRAGVAIPEPGSGGKAVSLAEAQTILARQSAEMDAQRERVVSTDPDSVEIGAPAGGREAALEAALRKAIDTLEIANDATRSIEARKLMARNAEGALRAVLALTPTDAAKAVRELVDDADHALSVLLAVKAQTPDGPLLVMVDDAIAGMCAALRPFGGAGDANGA